MRLSPLWGPHWGASRNVFSARRASRVKTSLIHDHAGVARDRELRSARLVDAGDAQVRDPHESIGRGSRSVIRSQAPAAAARHDDPAGLAVGDLAFELTAGRGARGRRHRRRRGASRGRTISRPVGPLNASDSIQEAVGGTTRRRAEPSAKRQHGFGGGSGWRVRG
jgi:hypothetical protein